MNNDTNYSIPNPIVNQRESEALKSLTAKYDKLITPSKTAQFGEKVKEHIPKEIIALGNTIGSSLSEQKLYNQMMKIIESGFKAVEERAAKFSISEKDILNRVNKYSTDLQIGSLNEISLLRSYDLAKLVNKYKNQDIVFAFAEGAGTGAIGFWGLPFNIVLSTFLYFRAVQSIAMFYGYDVKSDSSELDIASKVFTKALNPNGEMNDEVTNIIGKFMLMSEAGIVKQTAKKTWTDMAARGGLPLLLTQMRALAHKSAEKALKNAGAKGLESSLFKKSFELIGKKLTLKAIGKMIPVVSAAIGALIDTAQMNKILEFADIFYQKRFILEKEYRICGLTNENIIVIDAEIIDE